MHVFLRLGCFPWVGPRLAHVIAWIYTRMPLRSISVYDQLPDNCRPYNLPNDDCWYVLAPYSRDWTCLRSSRLLMITRKGGRIVFDGCASDEG